MLRTLLTLIAACSLAVAAPAAEAAKKAKTPTAKQCTKKAIKKLKGKKKATRVKACRKRAAALRKKKRAARKKPPLAAPPGVGAPGSAAPGSAGPAVPPGIEGGIDDAVVIAVIDGGFNPYHFDNLASRMPQHLNATKGDDLPLNRPFPEWLPGFDASKAGFKSFDRLDLSLSGDPAAGSKGLFDSDAEKWSAVKASDTGNVNAVWFPGTKVIGAIDFGNSELWNGAVTAHGVGTTSASVGNLHGTCPECLLLFIDYGNAVQGEKAIDWAMSQPWIDAISNSYGFSLATRDRIYSKSNTELQRQATERGQTVFFSSGNGVDGAYAVPNSTAFSSQEGPDWIVTVGAITPAREDNYYGGTGQAEHANYMSGKPADIAGIGAAYPTAYSANGVGETGRSGFGGTSNATPQIAGMYGRALYLARKALPGPSRAQEGGVVARGGRFACGAARPDCELGDGVLTRWELQTRLFHGATQTGNGTVDQAPGVATPSTAEQDFLSQGHGAYFGRESIDRDAWLGEHERITAPMEGRMATLPRAEGELEWMIVDSYCRQENWGEWAGGYYVDGETELPPPDPNWPARTQYAEACVGGPTPLN